MSITGIEAKKILDNWKSGYITENGVPGVCDAYITLYSEPLSISGTLRRKIAERIAHNYKKNNISLYVANVDSLVHDEEVIEKYDNSKTVFVATCGTIEQLEYAVIYLKNAKRDFDSESERIVN